MITASMDTFDGQRFGQDLLRHVRTACDLTAKQVPIDQTARIPAEITPDGSRQQQNRPATADRKRRSLGFSTPLRHTGTLADPSLYAVKRISEDEWKILLPANRTVIVVSYLRDLNYKYWEWSKELVNFLADGLKRVLMTMEANLDSYVRRP